MFSWRNKKNIMWIPHLTWSYDMEIHVVFLKFSTQLHIYSQLRKSKLLRCTKYIPYDFQYPLTLHVYIFIFNHYPNTALYHVAYILSNTGCYTFFCFFMFDLHLNKWCLMKEICDHKWKKSFLYTCTWTQSFLYKKSMKQDGQDGPV